MKNLNESSLPVTLHKPKDYCGYDLIQGQMETFVITTATSQSRMTHTHVH